MKVLAFGIVKDIFSNSQIDIALSHGDNVSVLKNTIEENYPQLKDLGSYMIAVNNEYAEACDIINEQ